MRTIVTWWEPTKHTWSFLLRVDADEDAANYAEQMGEHVPLFALDPAEAINITGSPSDVLSQILSHPSASTWGSSSSSASDGASTPDFVAMADEFLSGHGAPEATDENRRTLADGLRTAWDAQSAADSQRGWKLVHFAHGFALWQEVPPPDPSTLADVVDGFRGDAA